MTCEGEPVHLKSFTELNLTLCLNNDRKMFFEIPTILRHIGLTDDYLGQLQ